MIHRTKGFTLFDLLVSIAVVAVLMGLAVPAVGSALASARTGAAKASLEGSVLRSASRAGVAGTPVVMCPAQNDACLDSTDWSTGWMAFHDLDGDRTRSPAEPIMLREPALPTRTTLISTDGRKLLLFQPGGGNAGSNVTFTFCDSRGARRAVSLILSNAGRLREAPASVANGAVCVARLAARA